MYSATQIRFLVPTVNIGPFLANPDSSEAEDIVGQVRRACENTGFFQIIGHGLPDDLQRKLFQCSRWFFALPYEEKIKLDCRENVGRRGYDVLASQAYHSQNLPDLKEGFYVGPDISLDDPSVIARRFFMGPNVWPNTEHPAGKEFRNGVEEYFAAIHDLALKVLFLVERTLPYGPDVFKEFTTGHTVSVLRMLHYPPAPRTQPDSEKVQFGAGPHTDFGAITLLLQDDHPGLEVFDPVSKEFVPVDPEPNALVFNVGDMLSFWTRGRYRSSVHRVINKVPTERYSAAFFYDGALDCPLRPFDPKDGKETEQEFTVEKHMITRIAQSYSASQDVK